MEFLNAYSDSDDINEDEEANIEVPEQQGACLHGKPAAALVLPSALAAFDEVEGPPSFLNPEARRQFSFHPSSTAAHANSLPDGETAAAGSVKQHQQGKQKKQVPGPDFDISKLAPPLKGSKRDNGGSSLIDVRGQVNPEAVITGQAKRYKPDAQGPQVSLAQIAMLGGKIPKSGGTGGGGASKALSVDEFLVGKGGNAQMPRKGQDRRDKEKDKREKGQSAIGSWKSEAEMVLRQQYDS